MTFLIDSAFIGLGPMWNLSLGLIKWASFLQLKVNLVLFIALLYLF